MLKAVPFANAVAVVTAGLYVVCALLSYLAPDFILGIGQSWAHSVNIEALKAISSPSLGVLLWGLISITVLAWVLGYVFVWLYNRWSK